MSKNQQIKMENNKKEQVKKVDKPTKEEEVILVTTTYYYWRNWVKSILLEGKIKTRFVKDDVGWSGKISVVKSQMDLAKKVLADYKTKNPDRVDMW